MPTTRPLLPGLLCFGFIGLHAVGYLQRGQPYELLWCCTVANLLVGCGLLGRSPWLNAVGVCWLVFGHGNWIADAVVSRRLILTSFLIHFGALLVGLYGVRCLGWPRGAFIAATLGFIGLQLVCRLCTPPASNINVVFGLPAGFEWLFPSYPVYYAAMLVTGTAIFFATERLCTVYLSTRR